MSDSQYLVRSPILNATHQVVGYELSWFSAEAGGGFASDEELIELLRFVASQLVHAEKGWQGGDLVFFFEATPAVLASDAVESLPAKNTVFRLTAADLSDPDTLARAQALHELGYGISLCDADTITPNPGLLSVLTYAEGDFCAEASGAAAYQNANVQPVARRIDSWETYDNCMKAGMSAFVGVLYTTPREVIPGKKLNAAQVTIVRLMEMVRKNADVRNLEEVLKRDATVSYKLFKYINSAAFGFGVEIQSLRHAVTVLGYSPLYRWLSLLLAHAGDNSQAAILMQSAVIRGRIAELTGNGILPKGEAENLFVVGMFSLLDRLLGLPMEEVLTHIHLSDAVSHALVGHQGIYGPFLALAEACENGNGNVETLADSLFIDARHVNEAHLAALAWAQKVRL